MVTVDPLASGIPSLSLELIGDADAVGINTNCRCCASTASGPDAETTSREEFRGLIGTAEEVAAGIDDYLEVGADRFQIGVPKNDPETIDRFVDDVLGEF